MKCLHKYKKCPRTLRMLVTLRLSRKITTPVDTGKYSTMYSDPLTIEQILESVTRTKPTGSASALGTAQGYPQNVEALELLASVCTLHSRSRSQASRQA